MYGVSICVIAKNEEKNIAIFLEHIRGFYEANKEQVELLILDTGSEDNTVALAKEAGARVEFFSWINDFSAARNEAMRLAKYDMILFLDADEFLEAIDFDQILDLLKDNASYIGRLERRNLCRASDGGTCILVDRVERLIDRRLYHYIGRIHEQVARLDGGALAGYPIPLTVYHEGYMGSKEQLRDKAIRNNNLLYKELEDNPNEPYTYYQIGQSFSLIEDKEKELENYKKAYELIRANKKDRDAEYIWLLVVYLGNILLELGRIDEALALVDAEYRFFDDYADFLCMAGNIYMARDMHERAICMYKRAIYSSERKHLDGADSYRAAYNIGCIYEAYGAFKEAADYFELAGDFDEASSRLAVARSHKDHYFDKSISALMYIDGSLTNVRDILSAMEVQSIGFSKIELIAFVDASALEESKSAIKSFEQQSPESVIIIESDEHVKRHMAYQEALSYATTDAVVFLGGKSVYSFDAFRCLNIYLTNSGADLVADDIDYQQMGEFTLRLDSVGQRAAVRDAHILHYGLEGKLFSREYVIKSGILLGDITGQVELASADSIYCLRKRYRG